MLWHPPATARLPAGHRTHHTQRLGTRRHLVREGVIRRLGRGVAAAGEEANEVPALARLVIANRPAQNGIAGLERVQDGALRRLVIAVENEVDLTVHAGERAEVLRKRDADHCSVCASTESTAGRSRTIGDQLAPASDDA